MSDMPKWIKTPLEDVVSVIDPHPSHRAPDAVEHGIPFFGIGDLNEDGTYSLDKVRIVPEKVYDEHIKRYSINSQTIGFGRVATIGKVINFREPDTKYTVSPTLAVLQPNGNANRDFIFYSLKSEFVSEQIDKLLTGSTRSSLGIALLRKLNVLLPPDAQQQKIAEILSTVDNLIDQTQNLIEKYTSVKQGMMADLFSRGIDFSGTSETNKNYSQLRPSFAEAPELYQDIGGFRVPKDWEMAILNDYLNKIEQGWSPDCESEPANEGQWGVLKTTSVVWGGYAQKANKALPNSLVQRSEYEVKRGDVLMTRAGPGNRVGVVAYVHQTQSKLMLSDKLYRVVPTKRIEKEYLALLLSSEKVQRQIDATKTGLAESQSNISQDIVKKLTVFLPDIPEQKLVVERISAASNKINQEKTYLEKLKLMKKGLMQDLLTGKVKVVD